MIGTSKPHCLLPGSPNHFGAAYCLFKRSTMIGMSRRRLSVAGALLAALLLSHAAGAGAGNGRHRPGAGRQEAAQKEASFRIEGAVEKPGEWTAARLATEFAGEVKNVSFTLKGETSQARGVPLLAVLQAAGLRLNPKIKNHQFSFIVLVRAEDGYTIAYTLGEMLPQFGKRQMWLALDRNGKPFTGDDAPVQLIVPEDEKGARWVHGIRSITLVDGFDLLSRSPTAKAASAH
jgi:hypothetical protein